MCVYKRYSYEFIIKSVSLLATYLVNNPTKNTIKKTDQYLQVLYVILLTQ